MSILIVLLSMVFFFNWLFSEALVFIPITFLGFLKTIIWFVFLGFLSIAIAWFFGD